MPLLRLSKCAILADQIIAYKGHFDDFFVQKPVQRIPHFRGMSSESPIQNFRPPSTRSPGSRSIFLFLASYRLVAGPARLRGLTCSFSSQSGSQVLTSLTSTASR